MQGNSGDIKECHGRFWRLQVMICALSIGLVSGCAEMQKRKEEKIHAMFDNMTRNTYGPLSTTLQKTGRSLGNLCNPGHDDLTQDISESIAGYLGPRLNHTQYATMVAMASVDA